MASSSSSSLTSSTVNGTSRITGLASGLDVDSIVKQQMAAKSTKLHKMQQQKQLTEWRQEAYRDVISDLRTFMGKYFDVTSSSNMMSQKTFKQFKITSSSSAVTANYTSSANPGSHTVTVSQLATTAKYATNGRFTKDVQGSTGATYTSLNGKSFVISVDGTSSTVKLDSSVTDVTTLQAAINTAVGSGKVQVTADGSGKLTMAAVADSGVQKITISNPSTVSNSALSDLGFGAGAVLSNRTELTSTLGTIAGTMKNSFTFNGDGQIELTINGTKHFTFDEDTTLKEMMTEINNSDAGVKLEYNELNDQMVLSSKTTGAQQTLTISETGSTFLAGALNQYTVGQDAKVTIDDMDLTRSSNTFTVNGVTYTLNRETEATEEATVSLTQDVDGIYDSIKDFVDDYNTLIADINSQLSEEYDADYPPLTDDQEEEMSEKEIENWTEKAKTGLLEDEPLLQNFVSRLRSALIDAVPNQTALSAIGIKTGSWSEKGKLYIDETKLKEAIQSNPDGVMNLFSQESTSYPGTTVVRSLSSGEREARYKQEGIAYRFYDVLQSNIGTLLDNSNNKGLLLEKAGMSDDSSATDNALTEQIDNFDERIEREQDRLDDVETRLYKKYSLLESYISQMNSQISSMQSMLSIGSK